MKFTKFSFLNIPILEVLIRTTWKYIISHQDAFFILDFTVSLWRKIYFLFSANSHFSWKQVQSKEIHYQLMEISISWCHIRKSVLSKFFKKLFFLFWRGEIETEN